MRPLGRSRRVQSERRNSCGNAARAADQVIAVADQSKLARVQLINVVDTHDIDVVVTDAQDDHPTATELRRRADRQVARSIVRDPIQPIVLPALGEPRPRYWSVHARCR